MCTPPSASTITVRQTLDLLDGPFAGFVVGFSQGVYALWLGSGISFGRIAGLKQIVPRVVEFIRSKIAPDDPACRYAVAMKTVFDLAGLSDGQKDGIDIRLPFAD